MSRICVVMLVSPDGVDVMNTGVVSDCVGYAVRLCVWESSNGWLAVVAWAYHDCVQIHMIYYSCCGFSLSIFCNNSIRMMQYTLKIMIKHIRLASHASVYSPHTYIPCNITASTHQPTFHSTADFANLEWMPSIECTLSHGMAWHRHRLHVSPNPCHCHVQSSCNWCY